MLQPGGGLLENDEPPQVPMPASTDFETIDVVLGNGNLRKQDCVEGINCPNGC